MGLYLIERRPTRFPAQGKAWATMLFGYAMGVRQEFYAPFARFLAQNGVHVRASLHIAAGSGYYKFNDRMPILVRMPWFVYMPLFTPLFGYFPGKTLRAVRDLPRGVTWQWRRWCLNRDYLMSESEAWRASYARFKAPILSYSFEDDDINTKPGIDDLHSFYRGANVIRRHVQPRDARQRHIGHFGFFNERCREPLWLDALEWLRREIAGAEPMRATLAADAV